jgi:hypothetical protein
MTRLETNWFDPNRWTPSEKADTFPQWRKREADGLVGRSRMHSSSKPFVSPLEKLP